jgi:hypothetical protein
LSATAKPKTTTTDFMQVSFPRYPIDRAEIQFASKLLEKALLWENLKQNPVLRNLIGTGYRDGIDSEQ